MSPAFPAHHALLPFLLGGLCLPSVLATPAHPACEVQLSARMGEYRVDTGARGILSVQVRCPETGRYLLRFEGGGRPVQGPDARLTLTSPGSVGDTPATVDLQGLPPALPFNGTQRLDLTVVAPPGQWGLAAGQYQLPFAVLAVNLDSGDLP